MYRQLCQHDLQGRPDFAAEKVATVSGTVGFTYDYMRMKPRFAVFLNNIPCE